ncbi:MAG: hypothetical protein GC205_01430 [Bacteroidetes bacterium]|nr:hypothetical protein [Bacteroidota bacterium]
MRFVDAQVSMACPVPTPVDFWIQQSQDSLGFSTYGGRVQLDTFLVDRVGVPFEFNNADVRVVPGGDIVVLPGCTLRVFNGTTITNIQHLWNGITVLPGGRLEVEDSDICGAENAVHASLGFSFTPAEFRIEDSGLRRNITGIRIEDYTGGDYPGYVVGTHFEGGIVPTPTPGLPVVFGNSYAGIWADDVRGGTGLTIGEQSTLASANRFTRMDFGIYGANSSLTVFNNEFEDIHDIAGLNWGYGVYSVRNSALDSLFLSVGTSALRANTFGDCRYGVFSRGMWQSIVSDNTMAAISGPFERGVWLEQTEDTLVVGSNTISGFSQEGIWLNDNPGAGGDSVEVSVNNNALTGTFDETVGIQVNLLAGAINVNTNIISDVFRGIALQTLPSATRVQIDTNMINFWYAGVSSQAAGGILSLDVAEPEIFKNVISGNCPYPGGGGPCNTIALNNSKIRGIVLYRSPDAKVWLNYVEHSGAGMYVLRDNLEGNAICNEFHDSYSGVVWDNVDSAEFGVSIGGTNRVYGLVTDSSSSDNRWTSTIGGGFEPVRSYSINGSQAATIDWYYRNAATYDFPGGGTNLVDFSIGVTKLDSVLGATSNICSTLAALREYGGQQELGQGLSEYREHMLDQAIEAGSSVSIAPQLYAYLRWAHGHDVGDSRVSSLLSRTNLPRLESIEQAWETGNVEATSLLLDEMAPTNLEEAIYKQAWGIRLQRELDSARVHWTPEELESLQTIAETSWEQAGSAAVFAQSLLGVTLLPDEWEVYAEEELRQVQVSADQPKIVPNPVSNTAYVLNAKGYEILRIVDLQGSVCLMMQLNEESSQAINLQSLPNGPYVAQFMATNGQTATINFQVNR